MNGRLTAAVDDDGAPPADGVYTDGSPGLWAWIWLEAGETIAFASGTSPHHHVGVCEWTAVIEALPVARRHGLTIFTDQKALVDAIGAGARWEPFHVEGIDVDVIASSGVPLRWVRSGTAGNLAADALLHLTRATGRPQRQPVPTWGRSGRVPRRAGDPP